MSTGFIGQRPDFISAFRYPDLPQEPRQTGDQAIIVPHDTTARLPGTRTRFVRHLASALSGPCGVQPRSGLVLGVSGGADSLALVAGISALAQRPHLQYDLTIAHIHHHLRSESDEEARSVRDLAARLGLRFEHRDVYPNPSTNTAATARSLRYDALGSIAHDLDAAGVVTAHHGTDQLETVLLALARGTGIDGLAAMSWRTTLHGVEILRPLLDQTHDDCVALCESIGWQWHEDPSNTKPDSVRARLRHDVLPTLLNLAPDLDRRIHRTTSLLDDVGQLLHDETERVFGSSLRGTGTRTLDRDLFRQASSVVTGRGLRLIATTLGAGPDKLTWNVVRPTLEAILDEARDVRRFDWPDGIRITVRSDCVTIAHQEKEPDVD